MIIIGPLFSLRLWGTICPCCENSENKSARASLLQLNQLGTRYDPSLLRIIHHFITSKYLISILFCFPAAAAAAAAAAAEYI